MAQLAALNDQRKAQWRCSGQRLIPLAFGLLSMIAMGFAVFASAWHPEPAVGLRHVKDERDRKIALPLLVKTQAVFMAIGVGEYMLVTQRSGNIVTSRSPVNERLKRLPLLTKAFPDIAGLRMPMSSVETGAINLEVLLLEQPDVVVTWARLAADFERAGFTVVGLGPVSSPERLVENTVLFSGIIGSPERAAGILKRAKQEQERIAQTVASKIHSQTPMLMLVTLGEGRWRIGYGFRDVIDAAGGRNLGSAFTQITVSAEQLLNLSPEVVIIIGGAGLDDMVPARLSETPALRPLPAVISRRVFATPPGVSGYMGTVIELPIYMQWLADVLHPVDLGRNARMLAKRIYMAELGVEPNDGDLDDALAEFANRGSAVQTRVLNPVAR